MTPISNTTIFPLNNNNKIVYVMDQLTNTIYAQQINSSNLRIEYHPISISGNIPNYYGLKIDYLGHSNQLLIITSNSINPRSVYIFFYDFKNNYVNPHGLNASQLNSTSCFAYDHSQNTFFVSISSPIGFGSIQFSEIMLINQPQQMIYLMQLIQSLLHGSTLNNKNYGDNDFFFVNKRNILTGQYKIRKYFNVRPIILRIKITIQSKEFLSISIVIHQQLDIQQKCLYI